jgi:CHAD domain-containing protein/CYTH domain-containing protein
MPKYPDDLLQRPPTEAIEAIGSALLDEAKAAHLRLNEAADEEALHDFRVAIRRFRSVVRAFRPYVAHAVTRGIRRRLRGLAQSTNSARDAEVHILWIDAQRKRLTPIHRVGAKWFRAQLEKRRAAEYAVSLRTIEAEFPRLDRRTRHALSAVAAGPLGTGASVSTFGAVLGSRIRVHEATLSQGLDAVRGAEHEAAAHAARISGKRLRYLLELIAADSEPAERVVARIKALQDILGDLHDTQVVGVELQAACARAAAEHARRLSALDSTAQESDSERRKLRRRNATPGMVHLVRLCREAHHDLFAQFEAWRRDETGPLANDISEVLDEVAASLPAGVEIERKYLLSRLPTRLKNADVVDVDQGWLPGTRLVERIRRVKSAASERYYRTVKAGEGIARLEVEEEASADVFEHLWPLTEGRRVKKRRYYVPDGSVTWEIDEFLDRELVLAEIELPSADATVDVPSWLAKVVEREVTGEPEYVNVNLAR